MLTTLMLALTLAAQDAPAAPIYTLEGCNDPATRTAMLAAGPDGFPVFRAVKDHGRANDARMTVLLDRLTERAKLSSEQRGRVAMSMLEDPKFIAAFKQGATFLQKIMESMTKLTGKDDQADCRTVMELGAMLPAVSANADQQWDAMRLVLEAEAVRLGVSLAD